MVRELSSHAVEVTSLATVEVEVEALLFSVAVAPGWLLLLLVEVGVGF